MARRANLALRQLPLEIETEIEGVFDDRTRFGNLPGFEASRCAIAKARCDGGRQNEAQPITVPNQGERKAEMNHGRFIGQQVADVHGVETIAGILNHDRRVAIGDGLLILLFRG